MALVRFYVNGLKTTQLPPPFPLPASSGFFNFDVFLTKLVYTKINMLHHCQKQDLKYYFSSLQALNCDLLGI